MPMRHNKSQKKQNKAKYGLKLITSIKINQTQDHSNPKSWKKQVSEMMSKKQLNQNYLEQENSVLKL